MMWFFSFVATLFYSVFHNNEDSVLGIFFGLIATFILTPIFVLSVIQEFFLTHRRLHDLNASGWCQLILLIPFGQFLLIGLLFFKGTDGTNKYGDPPKY